MDRERLLKRMKDVLADALGERLRGIVLYGSEARGESVPESDIDLLVLLSAPVDFGKDLRACIHALYPLVLEIERPIHATPVDIDVYEAQEFPLYRSAKKEGLAA